MESVKFDNDDLYDSCASCGKHQNAASNLSEQIFKVNTTSGCGHKFCEICLNRELSRKRQFQCPKCHKIVSLDKLNSKSAEEFEAERDFAIRRKIKLIYNKTEADFQDLDSYKDYEEMVEDIIYNLVHEIDVAKTKEIVDQYSKENERGSAMNQLKEQERLLYELSLIEEAKRSADAKDIEAKERYRKELEERKQKQKLMNSFMLGEATSMEGLGKSSVSQVTATAPDPVLAFLAQRPEPKVIAQTQRQMEKLSNEQLRMIRMAGGYDYSQYDVKNWLEISSQIDLV